MKKIELKNLRSGQMIECYESFDGFTKDKLYSVLFTEFGKYCTIKNDNGQDKIFEDDEGGINTYFRLPVLTEGKEYECVSSSYVSFTKWKNYEFIQKTNKLYWFQSDHVSTQGGGVCITASEVFTHFGIVVGEEEEKIDLTCMNCGKEFKGEKPKMCCSGRDCGCMGQPIEPVVCSDECYDAVLNKRKQPPSDPPKPEVSRFEFNCIELADYHSYAVCDKQTNKVVCHLLYENGADYCKEYGNKIADLLNSEQQLHSRIKELEGEVNRFPKSLPEVANWCIQNTLRLPDELRFSVTKKLIQHLQESEIDKAIQQHSSLLQALKANGGEK